jgi:diguanylate cyclase (GGDEF)-like protein
VFGIASVALRETVALDQMPLDTPLPWRLANAGAYVAVLAVAIAGLRNLRRSQAQLAQLVIQDQLTNVLNARAFADRLGEELDRNRRYPRPLALLYMDLDNFKIINDSHGHQTGDAVLRLVADAMRSSVRHSDIVGRLGGDEFAVLMPETDAPLADAAAKRLVAGLRNVFKGPPNVTASIGVVSCTATDASTDDLLRRADQAMYDAKKMGKDRVVQVAL